MKIFLLLFLVFSFSCSAVSDNLIGSHPDCHYFFSRFPKNKKSVVIFKFFNESQIPQNLLFCRFPDDGSLIKETKFCVNFSAANKNQMMMVEPGIYSLVSYSGKYNNQNYIYKIDPKKQLSQKQHPVLFEVKASKIFYVGALYDKNGYMKFFDEFDLIEKNLKNKNYNFFEKNFVNKKQDLVWLIDFYHLNSKSVMKKMGVVDRKNKDANYSAMEKYVANLVKTGNQKDLVKLSKMLELINNEIEMEKHRIKLTKNEQN